MVPSRSRLIPTAFSASPRLDRTLALPCCRKVRFGSVARDSSYKIWCGAEGRIRTGTGYNSQRFLRPPRLPFRHFGMKREGQSPHRAIIGNAPRARQQLGPGTTRPGRLPSGFHHVPFEGHIRTENDVFSWRGRGRPRPRSLGARVDMAGGRCCLHGTAVVRSPLA